MKVKICGLTTAEQVTYCVEQGANFCGFILNYPKSHRYIDYQTAETLTSVDKKNSSYVGILVNPKEAELETFSKLNLDYFQIYGEYTKDQIKEFNSIADDLTYCVIGRPIYEGNALENIKNIINSAK